MDNMGNFLPARFSVKWLYWFVGLSLVFVIGLYLAFDPSKTMGWQGRDWFGILVLGIGAGIICSLIGFFRYRWAFMISCGGVIAGIFVLAKDVRQIDGWGDLIGLISFMMLIVLGVVAGFIVELIVYLARKRTEREI